MKSLLCSLLSLLLCFSCLAQNGLHLLDNKASFDRLSALPLTQKYGQISAVKVIYDLKRDEIHFVNANEHKYHHEYCSAEIDYDLDLPYFNKVNYSQSPSRKYLLGNINYYHALDKYVLEISPADLMHYANIVKLWNEVARHSFIVNDLFFLVNSPRLQKASQNFPPNIPILFPYDIYKNQQYQPIGQYKNCGKLRFINNLKNEESSILPDDIIVLKETPLILPPVAGVVITEFQTPLSHLTILAQNRKIPIIAYKKAFENPKVVELNNEKVCFQVTRDSFFIKKVDSYKLKKQKKAKIELKSDLLVKSLLNIDQVDRKSFAITGNKAANFGTLAKLSKDYDFKVPEAAFVIPFYFYDQHVTANGTKKVIEELLSSTEVLNNRDSLKQVLKAIRRSILKAPIDENLNAAVTAKIRENGSFTRMRFRSSTNAEDAKGFSGAGLYSSKTGILDDDKKTFERAIKKVWASLWNYQAFAERELFEINHNEVYMAVLVHRSFPDEKVNGVAITKNLYRYNSAGFVINAQKGNESVVMPENGNISDQFICYPDNVYKLFDNKNMIDIITQSNLSADGLLMSEEEIQNLANVLEKIKKYYKKNTYSSKSYLLYGLDLEFKLEGEERELYIKQLRLYND